MTSANSAEIVDAFWDAVWKSRNPETVDDFEFHVIETFQNADGSRVASRWQIAGRNNGVLGTEPDGQPISFTGTAMWAVRAGGKLLHNGVERASWELYQRLNQAA